MCRIAIHTSPPPTAVIHVGNSIIKYPPPSPPPPPTVKSQSFMALHTSLKAFLLILVAAYNYLAAATIHYFHGTPVILPNLTAAVPEMSFGPTQRIRLLLQASGHLHDAMACHLHKSTDYILLQFCSWLRPARTVPSSVAVVGVMSYRSKSHQ